MTSTRAVGILVAAGSGERLQAGARKAFVEVAGAPLLVHAARALAACRDLDDLVVVVAEADVDRAGKLLAEAGVAARAVVTGGAERHESVARGLEALAMGDLVAIVIRGKIRQTGPISEVFSRPIDVEVAASLGVEAVLPARVVESTEGLLGVAIGAVVLHVVDRDSLAVGSEVYVCIRAEDVTLAALARAHRLPLRWTETRVEHMVATTHGRAQVADLEAVAPAEIDPALREHAVPRRQNPVTGRERVGDRRFPAGGAGGGKEHDLRVASRLASRMVAFDHGVKIAEGTPAEVRCHPDVVKAYLGE